MRIMKCDLGAISYERSNIDWRVEFDCGFLRRLSETRGN